MSRLLVTGSTGFIGAHLCRALVARGEQVRAFHRPTSPLDLLEGLPLEHVAGDLTEPESLRRAVQGVEAVFHAAAQLGSRGDPRRIQEVTVGGARALFQAALVAGVQRVVLTSSVAALGVPRVSGSPGSHVMNETHTWNYPPKRWLYGYAKYLAELEAQEAVARGLEVVIVNPSVVVGAGDINRVSGEALLRIATRRLPVTVQGGLNAVHVQDVVAGHLAAWERGRVGERYILGGENMTHRQFLSLAAETAGVPQPWLHLPAWLVQLMVTPGALLGRLVRLPIGADSFHRAGVYFYYDSSKARQELGLGQPGSIRQAISESLDWYRQRGVLPV